MTYYIPKSELGFMTKKAPLAQRGSLKKRLQRRLRKLKDKNISHALSILDEKERIEIVENMIDSLEMASLEELSNKYEKIFKDIHKNEEFLSLIRKEGGVTLGVKEAKKIKSEINKGKNISDSLKKIIYTKEFVLKRKKLRDKVYMNMTLTKEQFENPNNKSTIVNLFYKIKKIHQIKIKKIIGKGKTKIIFKELYDRGIILPQGITQKDFLDNCRKKILKTKHKPNTYFPKDIFPFKLDEREGEKLVRINPYYKNFKFEPDEQNQLKVTKSSENNKK